ncbi:hypothetical protein AB0O47_18960 [Streptomyces noursei]|uniref:hypothetical protein n=1 Tax=Streptomyces TaxID=1883 RepID=UPI002380CA6D|nr:hypothetical protein [Streptomyces sp. WZ-12]
MPCFRASAGPAPMTVTRPERSEDFRSAFVYGIAMAYVVSQDTTPPHATITDFNL